MIRLAADLAETGAPLELERAVLAEFDRVQRRKRGRVWMAAIGTIAASVVGVWMLHQRAAPKPVASPAIEAQADSESEQPFVPIPYVLPPDQYERVEIVRVKLPVSELIAAGFRMQTADPGAQAEADVIVGQDGRPRAVRLISISSFN
jgi:hypothetical protein